MLHPQRPSADTGNAEILSLSQNNKKQACRRDIFKKLILFGLHPNYYKPTWFEGETEYPVCFEKQDLETKNNPTLATRSNNML